MYQDWKKAMAVAVRLNGLTGNFEMVAEIHGHNLISKSLLYLHNFTLQLGTHDSS